jgi:hypothetical protein
VLAGSILYTEKHSKPPRKYKKGDIQEIFRTVKIPDELSIKYKSNKYKRRPLVTLLDRKQFAMRWWGIKDQLIVEQENRNYEPVMPEGDLCDILRDLFTRIMVPFTYIRHEEACKGNLKECHKKGKCRYATPHAYFIILEFMKLISPALHKKYGPDFPQITLKKRRQLYTKYWQKMVVWLNWPQTLHSYLIKRYPGSPIVKKYILNNK